MGSSTAPHSTPVKTKAAFASARSGHHQVQAPHHPPASHGAHTASLTQQLATGKPSAGRSNAASVAVRAASKWVDTNNSAGTGVAGSIEHGISVNSNFDSGNIEVVNLDDPQNIQLQIHRDPYTEVDEREHFQWWYYRITGIKDTPIKMHIINADEASYTAGWEGYQACCSYDRKHWFRVPTEYDAEKGELVISHTPDFDSAFYAYWAPYTYEQHMQLISELQCHYNCTLIKLGETNDGHDLDLLRIGEPGEGKKKIWMTARAHPGETMAEYFAEGFLYRLTDAFDPLPKKVLEDAVFYIIPNMNPDGSWRGHLRTNAMGANLNREWANPCMEYSPEVYLVRQEMDAIGVDFLVDVHGDEALPYCFIAGSEGIPSWDDRLKGLQDAFCDAFKKATPNFQTEHGYDVEEPGKANMGVCSNQVAERYNCLAFTLEMPFKDCANNPNSSVGWSPDRARRLGASLLNPIADVMPMLR